MIKAVGNDKSLEQLALLVGERVENDLPFGSTQELQSLLVTNKNVINKSLGYISEAMNLKHRLTTYVARHSFATVLKRSGVNIGIISELMGHANLATTEIYLDGFEEKQVEQAMQHLV